MDEGQDLRSEVDELAAEVERARAAIAETEDLLAALEARYRLEVAPRLARLERLQADLATIRVGRRDAEAEARAEEAERLARTESPRERWKSMLKRIHPDRATSDVDREEREELSKRVNDAWTRGDTEALDLLEAEIDYRTIDQVDPDERSRILARIRARLDEELRRLLTKLDELRSGALWELAERVQDADAEGRDYLAEQSHELDEAIAAVEAEIALLRSRFPSQSQ